MFARVPSKSQEPIGAFADARLPTHILGLVEEILTSPHRSDRDTSLKILSDALTDRSLSPSVGAWMERLGELGEAYLYYHPRELPFCLKQAAYQEVAESKIEFEGFSTCLQVLPNGTLVVGGGREGNGMILIFPKDGKTGSYGEPQVLRSPASARANANNVMNVQVLPDCTIIAGEVDGTVRIWPKNGTTGSYGESQVLKEGSLYYETQHFQALPNGTIIVAGGRYGTIDIFPKDDQTGSYGESQVLRVRAGAHTSMITSLQVLPDGAIVTGEMNGMIRIWPKDGKTGSYGEAQVLKECSRSTFPCLQVLPDGSIVANGRGGNHDMILIFPKDSETGSYGEPQGLRDRSLLPSISPCLQVLPNGTIVAGGESGSICIWSKNDETGSYGEVPQQILRGAGNTRVASLQVLPNGTIVSIESTHARSTVRTWTGRITGVSIVT